MDIDYGLLVNFLVLVVLIVVPLYVYRRESEQKTIESLRPYFAQLKHSLEGVANREGKDHFAHQARGITSPLEEMQKSSLDITLRKNAPRVWKELCDLDTKLKEIDKECEPFFNDANGYWKEYPKLLEKRNNLKIEREALYTDVLSWLERHS